MSDPPQKRPARQMRQITPLLRDAAPLLMLASALFYTNRWLALNDEETSTLSAAAQNVTTLFAAARSAAGNARPPVYELLLHLWLRITGGAFDWLRAPAIVCFVLGLWLLSRVARQLGGEETSSALVWLGALWPFGFHAGRLAGPYSFAFLLIAAVTWQYLRYTRSRRGSDGIIFSVLSLVLLYTNDFGWAMLVLLEPFSGKQAAQNKTKDRGNLSHRCGAGDRIYAALDGLRPRTTLPSGLASFRTISIFERGLPSLYLFRKPVGCAVVLALQHSRCHWRRCSLGRCVRRGPWRSTAVLDFFFIVVCLDGAGRNPASEAATAGRSVVFVGHSDGPRQNREIPMAHHHGGRAGDGGGNRLVWSAE